MKKITTTKRRKFAVAIGLLAIAPLTLQACGSSDESTGGAEEVTIRLNWSYLGQHLGIADAKAKGYYEDAGLNVNVSEGKGSQLAATEVASGKVEFALVDSGTAMLTGEKTGKIVSVANPIATGGYGFLVDEDSDIKTFKDIVGHTVLITPGTAQASLLPVVMKVNGLSMDQIKLISVDSGALFTSFANGTGDTMANSIPATAPLVDKKRPTRKILWDEYGLPIPDYSIITNKKTLEEKPEMVANFLKATMKGWKSAKDNPAGAADALVKESPTFDKAIALEVWEAWTPLFCAPDSAGQSLGWHNPNQWEKASKIVAEGGNVTQEFEPTDLYTNQFFEGAESVGQETCP